MKKLLLFALVAGACLAGYCYRTGALPWAELSPDEQQIAGLREDFALVRQQWKQAGRAATFGLDTGTITDSPLAKLEKLEGALADLLPRLKTPEARAKASALRQDIASFKREMR